MTSGRTYYELFGVSQDATAQQIRQAYLKLLKQHHPDLAPGEEMGSKPDFVPLINRCYAVLRDPQKRAAYDAQLARSTAADRLSRLPAVQRRPRQRPGLWLAIVVGLVAVAVGTQIPISSADEAGWNFIGKLGATEFRSDARLAFDQPSEAEVRRTAQLATVLSGTAAVAWSQRCFRTSQRAGDLTGAALCIIFDQAFVYWRKAPADLTDLPIYYNEEVAQIRHEHALSDFGGDVDAEVQALSKRALLALLAEINSTSRQGEFREPAETVPERDKALAKNGTN